MYDVHITWYNIIYLYVMHFPVFPVISHQLGIMNYCTLFVSILSSSFNIDTTVK